MHGAAASLDLLDAPLDVAKLAGAGCGHLASVRASTIRRTTSWWAALVATVVGGLIGVWGAIAGQWLKARSDRQERNHRERRDAYETRAMSSISRTRSSASRSRRIPSCTPPAAGCDCGAKILGHGSERMVAEHYNQLGSGDVHDRLMAVLRSED